MPQVLIADDHPLMRIAVAHILARDPDMHLQQAASFPELHAALLTSTPDVLILEPNMPGGRGLDVIPGIRKQHPKLGILVLSVHPESPVGVQAILAGAHSYMHKSSTPEQLMDALGAVARGCRHITLTLGAALGEALCRGGASQLPHKTLSPRELAVLVKISEGFTTAEIAGQLSLSPKTAGTYRSRIIDKMGILTTAELTRYVIEQGLDKVPV